MNETFTIWLNNAPITASRFSFTAWLDGGILADPNVYWSAPFRRPCTISFML